MASIEETTAKQARKLNLGKSGQSANNAKDKRIKRQAKLTAQGAAGKEYTDAKSNMTVIGGTVGKSTTIATCNEIAAMIGVDGKRFRGWPLHQARVQYGFKRGEAAYRRGQSCIAASALN